MLKDENSRLRQIAGSMTEVERMKLENKVMRLELQKYKVMESESSSAYNLSFSPIANMDGGGDNEQL